MTDNNIVQVPHVMLNYPFFFVANNPKEGFLYRKPNRYGDLITISAEQTPRVREAIVFLAALIFVQDKDIKKEPEFDNPKRVTISISKKEWMKTAGFGRSSHDTKAFEDAIDILSKVSYAVEPGKALRLKKYQDITFTKRPKGKDLPFTKAIYPGLFGDVDFNEDGTVTIRILRNFVQDLDKRALRVSLTHMLQVRGHIARVLVFMLYGKKSWAGSWEELAELVRIDTWSEKRYQRRALRKAITELDKKGFTCQVSKNSVLIKRTIGLPKMLPDYK